MGRLPDWCDPLLDADMMRAVDRWAIQEREVPSLELMERAGSGVAQIVEQLEPDGEALVLCGKGNNGGDGLVVARLLRHAGRNVTVLCACAPEELSGDARANLERLPGDPPIQMLPGAAVTGDHVERAGIVVDALLGTGFDGVPHGIVGQAIEHLNRAASNVVSVDVPSGVDASTGAVRGAAVRASVTVTFHASKPGLWINPGKAHAGEVRKLDIGIPRGAPGAAAPGAAGVGAAGVGAAAVGLIGPSVLALLPRRGADATKFRSGHVVIAGGSRGLSGAPRMAGQASMRTGAGYVTACVPVALEAILAGSSLELMTLGLPEADGEPTAEGVQTVHAATRRGGALVLGPGLGRGEGAVAFARELARAAGVAMVLDADGLNAHAGCLGELAERSGERGAQDGGQGAMRARMVLTPHAGELARLRECDSAEIERERLGHVRAAAEQAQAVVVLKGDDTLVAAPNGLVAVSPGGSPALATAGTGDVLSGVIGALLAQGLDDFTAACAGVWLHVLAGRLAARKLGVAEGVIASDVIAALPAARLGEHTIMESTI